MKKTGKALLSIFLTLLLAVLPLVGVPALALDVPDPTAVYGDALPVKTLQIGEQVWYTLYEDGHVCIYGSGNSYTNEEWNGAQGISIFGDDRMSVTSLEILPDVTGLLINYAFNGCHNMKTLRLSADLTALNPSVCYHLSGLEQFAVDPENPVFSTQDGVLFNKEKTELIFYPLANPRETYTVPSSVLKIDENAFFTARYLKEVTFADTLKTIGKTAFMGCEALEAVHFGSGLETMAEGAFYRCYQLQSVALPDSLKVIERYTFGDEESLTSVSLGKGVTELGEYAFGCCPLVESITLPGSLTSVGNSAFYLWNSLAEVNYTCTLSEWEQIDFGDYNDPVTGADVNFLGHCNRIETAETAATATEHGYTAGVQCADCGKWLSGHEVIHNTLGHWTILAMPTEDSEGEAIIVCTVCGESGLYAIEEVPEGVQEANNGGSGPLAMIHRAIQSFVNWVLRLIKWLGGK